MDSGYLNPVMTYVINFLNFIYTVKQLTHVKRKNFTNLKKLQFILKTNILISVVGKI